MADRNSMYRSLAELRVALCGYVNKLPDYMSAKDIATQPEIIEVLNQYAIGEQQVFVQLRALAEVGLINLDKTSPRDFKYVGKGYNPDLLKDKIGTQWKSEAKAAIRVISIPKNEILLPPEEFSVAQNKAKKLESMPKVMTTPKPASNQAAITMDVVKETGRVRLTIGGLTIEIGVVDR